MTTELKPQCKDYADLYEHIARVLRMCEKAGIEPNNAWKLGGELKSKSVDCAANYIHDKVEFAVGIVDGVPVSRGDTVYYVYRGLRGGSEEYLNGTKCTITGCGADGKTIFAECDGGSFIVDGGVFSLKPPKPKTCTITLNCDISKIALLGDVGDGHLLSFPVDTIKDPMKWLKQQVENNKGAA